MSRCTTREIRRLHFRPQWYGFHLLEPENETKIENLSHIQFCWIVYKVYKQLSQIISVTRCSEENIADNLVKIARFVSTVNNQSFKKPKLSTTKPLLTGDFGQKKLSPKASENRQNGEKLPNLVTLQIITLLNFWNGSRGLN